MKTIKTVDSSGTLQRLEVIEDLGYQIGIDAFVVRAKLPTDEIAIFHSPSKRGIYRRYQIQILPGGPVTGQ